MEPKYKSYEQAALDILRGKKPEEKVVEQKQQEPSKEKQPVNEASKDEQVDEAIKPELDKNFPASGVTKHTAPKTPASTMPKDKEKRGPMAAGSMKKEEVDVDEAVMHPMALHVKRVPGQMKNGQEVYKVHAVGSKVSGIKTGEHLNDTELDDATEAGHKVKMMKEDAEQIEELKASTMMSYKDKANKEIKALDKEVKTGEYKDIAGKIMNRRMKGADMAANKLATRKEEVEEIEELSKSTLASYAKKAAGSSSTASKIASRSASLSGHESKPMLDIVSKRTLGIKKAVNRLAKEEIEMEDVDFTIIEHNAFVVELPESFNYTDYFNAAKVIVENEQDVVTVADYFFNLKDESLIIEAFTRGDIEDKVKAHQNAGHQVTMPKYSTKEGKPYAEYTVMNKDTGQKTRYIHHGTTRKTERLG